MGIPAQIFTLAINTQMDAHVRQHTNAGQNRAHTEREKVIKYCHCFIQAFG